ncbi:phospholipase D family protein [Haliea sp. E17]|uniref:phospholipase D family protein n=1 Tax=Haliea sp. E17 TaxID=3401576 RepID=UPI003AAB7987
MPNCSRGRTTRLVVLLAALLLSACSSLPSLDNRSASYAPPPDATTALAQYARPMLDKHPGESGFKPLVDGEDAFIARLRLIAVAEKTVDAQYYIWHDDLTGRVLHYALLQAADRGVRVRLLLDDLDTAGKDTVLRTLDAHPNIEVRVFNPFANRQNRAADFLGDTSRVNRRMHNKTLTVDGMASIFGGRNIGDEYFAAGEDVGFGDMDAVSVGGVAGEIESQFDLYWNSDWAYPIASFSWDSAVTAADLDAYRSELAQFMDEARHSHYAQILKQYRLATSDLRESDFSWSPWVLAYDQPDKVVAKEVSADTHLAPQLRKALDITRHDLVIVSPYFVPGEQFTEYLTDMVQRGVRVRILTNSLAANDVSLVHAGYMRYRKALLRGGVELYEYRADANKVTAKRRKEERIGASKASLHGKFFGFDRSHLFIGSFNLDGRSYALNTELGVYFASPQQAGLLSDSFDAIAGRLAYQLHLDDRGDIVWHSRSGASAATVDHEPDTTWWQRFSTRVLSWIVPESQL